MSEPWTRAEQVNYAVFGSKKAPPQWGHAIHAISELALATGYVHTPGYDIFKHFTDLRKRYEHASMSVD